MDRVKIPMWCWTLLGSAIFAACHTQPALYYSNQNQYFLHALARYGVGELPQDWLANTQDPTPFFSTLIVAVLPLGTWIIHAVFFLLLMLYAMSIWWIVQATRFRLTTISGRAAWWTIWTLIHSGVLRATSAKLFGVDYPWYFQAGVANQYLLGAGLQPSVFGVLLLTSLAAWAHEQSWLACSLAAAAAAFHSTYLLPAGIIVGAIIIPQIMTQHWKFGLLQGFIAVVIVLPTIWQAQHLFLSSSPEIVEQAHAIIVRERIPHHCMIQRWLDPIAALQVLWCLIGVMMTLRERWGWPLASLLIIGGMLSVWQFGTDSNSLALLFPWRVSAVLVPVSTAIIAAAFFVRFQSTVSLWSCCLLSLVCLLATPVIYYQGVCYPTNPAEDELFDVARAIPEKNATFLIPAKFPKPSKNRGTSSSSFVPLASSTSLVFELQRFRLATGRAIYVDFKSIPYQSEEVFEWRRRVQQVEQWYDSNNWDELEIMPEIRRCNITHILWPSSRPKPSQQLKAVGEAAGFIIYALSQDKN